jgi:hypothetical protein
MHRRTTVPRHLSFSRTAVLALPLLAALGCADSVPPMAPGGPIAPQHLLSDGSTDGEFEGFLFLPPLVANPNKGGQTSMPGLAPHAEVCLLDTSAPQWACVQGNPHRTFAPSEIVYDSDHYKVDWDTKDPAHAPLLTSSVDGTHYTYRLTVLLGSLQLGFVDLQFGSNGGTAKNLTTDDVIGLKDGRTVPVKFFIGSLLEADLGCVGGLDCQVATFTAGEETTILSRDRQAVLHIPAGATGGTGTIVARIAEIPLADCDLGVNLPTYNSCYEYDLFPKQVLSQPVIVGQCLDTNSVPPGRLGEVQLGARHYNPPAGIPEFELMPNVAAPAGLSCDGYVPAMAANGVAAALRYAVRGVADFVFGTPAYAGHSGLGGAVRDLSTIAWVDPGLRIAGFSLQRGGFSSLSSAALLPAMQALEATYPNVWRDTASTITATLLDGDVDVVLLGTGFSNAGAITALSPAEQSALFDYVMHGGCAILLPDNSTFGGGTTPAVNQSLINAFGLSITGTINGAVTATVTGTSAAVQGITSFTQNYPGWFNGIGQGTTQATNSGGPAMVEIAAGVLGPHSGPVFAFSDVNMFFAAGAAGYFNTGQNAQLFLNTVNACGTEPLP